MKLCSKCKECKDESEFHKNKRSPDGLSYWCKKCVKQNGKKCYSNSKEHYRQKWVMGQFEI